MNSRESYTMIAITFIALLFMMVVLTYTLATPIDTFYETILNADMGSTINTYKNTYIPIYREATIMVFALSVAMPFGYIIAKVFGSEPYDNPYERSFKKI